MRVFNSCKKQESGRRLTQDWLIVRDHPLPMSFLTFLSHNSKHTSLLNLFSNYQGMMYRGIHSKSLIAGGKRGEQCLLVFLFTLGRSFPPKFCHAPSLDLSTFHRSDLGHLLIPVLAKEKRDYVMNLNQ